MHCRRLALWLVPLVVFTWPARAESDLASELTFFASFDRSADADFARGDGRIYTAESAVKREAPRLGIHTGSVTRRDDGGRWGGALHFGKKSEPVVLYRGAENVAYQPDRLEGTVSLWMRLHPDEDLEPGYVDPLQVTDKQWNDACLFLDFTRDEQPRHFRLGVFSNLAIWNPTNRDWDSIPVAERPMIVDTRPPFSRDRWTHVAFTFRQFNTPGDAQAQLYLDGKSAGVLKGRQKFQWNTDMLVIILGIYYTGGIDELSVFNRPLTEAEIGQLQSTSVSQLCALTIKE